jgi:nucleoside-diphosphate-sugar epimerase
MKKVLLTGGLGFIGKFLLKLLVEKNFEIYLLVRPATRIPDEFINKKIIPVFADLENIDGLVSAVNELPFDTVFHIGAIRGGRASSQSTYWKVNVEATEVLAYAAMKRKAKFIFCSSVGVFGAIPKELPASEGTERQKDNYYHYTKIVAEERLKVLGVEGLRYIIIRPAVTYAPGDTGFPYGLIKLIDKGLFFLPYRHVCIHLTNATILAQAFMCAATLELLNGSAYIVADKEPVDLCLLADDIAESLGKRRGYYRIPDFFFAIGEFLSGRVFKNELWKSRFQLISRSWYYDVRPMINDLGINPVETLRSFSTVIDWYKKIK